ncbi:SCO5717 family growth-regulating ATPase, partial [Streptomyces beijiangensis]
MSRDRSEYSGNPSPDGEERDIDLTGEFEIDYAPPAYMAWYDQTSGGSGAQAGPSGPPPPTGAPVGPPGVAPGQPVPPPPAAPQQQQPPQQAQQQPQEGYGYPQQA